MYNATLSSQQNWNQSMKIYDQYINSRDTRHILIVEVIAIAGALIMLTGYKFLRFAMFVCGFWLSFCVFYVFSPIFIRTQYFCDKERFHAVHIGSSLAFGIVVGVFTSSMYRFGVFLIGKCLGVLVALLILHLGLITFLTSEVIMSCFIAVMALIVASLTWRFEKVMLISATSLLGSYMLLCGVDIFVRSNFSLLVFSVLLYIRDAFVVSWTSKSKLQDTALPKLHAIQEHNTTCSIFVAAWFFQSALSAGFQYQVSSKDVIHGGKTFPFSLKTVCECLLPCCHECMFKTNADKK